jgi:hypothetical protein
MKRIQAVDFLRGLGVFFVIILHTAFYYFDGIYDVDMDNPSLIITLIGFLLMFAGLFAMVSGLSYTIQFMNAKDRKTRIQYMGYAGLLMMIIAYLYFLFTGPGIIHFDSRSMDESLLVSFIRDGSFQPWTLERIFYVDSLVMIAFNIWLLALLFICIKKAIDHPKAALYVLLGATLFMIISYVRIPLYNVYLDARDEGNYLLMILLNWLVAKNNPILPFYAFALFGVWVALLLKRNQFKVLRNWVLPVGLVYMVVGILGFILTPETMLERAIDPTWYFIMVTQIGLFLLMVLLALYVFDFKQVKFNPITRFIKRFGVSGLTPFFFEQITSAILFLIINQFITLKLDIPGAILYGFIHVLMWGFILMAWEKKQYKYTTEWAYTSLLNRISPSSKHKALEDAYASR